MKMCPDPSLLTKSVSLTHDSYRDSSSLLLWLSVVAAPAVLNCAQTNLWAAGGNWLSQEGNNELFTWVSQNRIINLIMKVLGQVGGGTGRGRIMRKKPPGQRHLTGPHPSYGAAGLFLFILQIFLVLLNLSLVFYVQYLMYSSSLFIFCLC